MSDHDHVQDTAHRRTRLAHELLRLPALYRELGERHDRARPPAWERSPAPRQGRGGILHAPAADLRAAMLSTLASWAGLTVQERGLRAPRRDVDALSAFLARHLDFLVRHPAAEAFTSEIAALTARAERVARPGESVTAVRARAGACPAPGCEGTLVAHAARGRGAPAHVRCDSDPLHSWSGPQRTASRGQWLSPADISTLWGIARGSVYRLASENGWDRRTSGRRTHYAAGDVRRTLGEAGHAGV